LQFVSVRSLEVKPVTDALNLTVRGMGVVVVDEPTVDVMVTDGLAGEKVRLMDAVAVFVLPAMSPKAPAAIEAETVPAALGTSEKE